MDKELIEVYTDGACSGNPGKGGWAAILIYKQHRKYLSGGYRKTTNNRMELMAVIEALSSIKPQFRQQIPVIVYSDSKYIVDNINNGHIYKWTNKKFKNVKNPDLWEKLIQLISEFKDIKFVWIEGHSTNTINNQCDKMAVNAYQNKNTLNIDEYYENPSQGDNNTLL